jgi:hypothetical protein
MKALLRIWMAVLAMGLAGAQAQDRFMQHSPPGQGFAPGPPPGPPPGWGGPPPISGQMPRILNDTPEYCDELRDDIARIRNRRGGISDDVEMLAEEGERMCQIGHFRPGIFRLRTALMMLRSGR